MQDFIHLPSKSPTQTSQSYGERLALTKTLTGDSTKKKKNNPPYQISPIWVVGGGGLIAPNDRKQSQPAKTQAQLPRSDSNNGRENSISSNSVTASSVSISTGMTTDPTTTDSLLAIPFTKKHGRKCLRDPSLQYPLPCDLPEIHRQILRTMLLVEVFGGPICSSNFKDTPPKKVLEVACGTGYWSSLCHQHFSEKGYSVSFTGLDIAPLAPDLGKEDGMNWRFVQHDIRKNPLPFRSDEFDLVMVKDVSLVTSNAGLQQNLMDDYLRILRPGGTLEVWDGDHTLRMLLPHVIPAIDDGNSENEEQEHANATGTYKITAQTPLTAPQNQYLMEYNGWIAKALELRQLSPMPCTIIRPLLLQEAEDLVDMKSRRLAVPLGEVRWEREGVGGAITKDPSTSSGRAMNGKGKEPAYRKVLTTAQAALRRTALLVVVQMIESLEPLLREVSGKGQVEWDRWYSNMMNDLMKQNGTSWGECLEIGAWWATKKSSPIKRAATPAKQEVIVHDSRPPPPPLTPAELISRSRGPLVASYGPLTVIF